VSYTRRTLERDYGFVFTGHGDGRVTAETSFRSPAVGSRPVGIMGDVIRRSSLPAVPVRFGPSSEEKVVASANSWLERQKKKGWQATWRVNGWPLEEQAPVRKRKQKPTGDVIAA
jgi:hypothetical protein